MLAGNPPRAPPLPSPRGLEGPVDHVGSAVSLSYVSAQRRAGSQHARPPPRGRVRPTLPRSSYDSYTLLYYLLLLLLRPTKRPQPEIGSSPPLARTEGTNLHLPHPRLTSHPTSNPRVKQSGSLLPLTPLPVSPSLPPRQGHPTPHPALPLSHRAGRGHRRNPLSLPHPTQKTRNEEHQVNLPVPSPSVKGQHQAPDSCSSAGPCTVRAGVRQTLGSRPGCTQNHRWVLTENVKPL